MTETTKVFEPFTVTVQENRRYWEDESTGVMVKKGQFVKIGPRQFRSAELRFALIRSQVIITEGEAVFAFRENIVKITPGKNGKNIVEDMIKKEIPEAKQDEPKKDIPKDIPKKEEPKKDHKKIVKPSMDDIPDLEEDI
jgi:hypothetical protein